MSGLQADEGLASTGIAVLRARVRSVRAEADMEKFLQTPARAQELVTQEGTTARTREQEAAAEAAHVGAYAGVDPEPGRNPGVLVTQRADATARLLRTVVAGTAPVQIVAIGTGSTGWATSIHRERRIPPSLPTVRDGFLSWFVREAWPSPTTGMVNTDGLITAGEELSLVVEPDLLVVFGDGLEADRLTATWGQTIAIAVSRRTLWLVG